MIQIIYSSILIILGPFSVAASILPAFRDSFSTWIARFVSVNLYSGIAYLIMYLCGLMQEYALTSEISKYQELVGHERRERQPGENGLVCRQRYSVLRNGDHRVPDRRHLHVYRAQYFYLDHLYFRYQFCHLNLRPQCRHRGGVARRVSGSFF